MPLSRFLRVLLLATLLGCNTPSEKSLPDPPQGRRSEVVQAKNTPASSPPSPVPSPLRAPRPPVCSSSPAAAGRSLPGGILPHLAASGAPPLPGRIPTGNGQWTWVNLWAAWCKPCKEEIPLLRAWETQLASSPTPFRLAFLSLDDDERQARKFLEEQPTTGLRASWWLQEGKGRIAWLEALQLPEEPRLPVHLLFDPQGALRCIIDGAVEPTDFAAIQARLARR
ncbi:MAG: TlpA disulfide reductase family protein [Myxococcales bacterium]|nr:TlpA family protein disulfide reductase [Polyangiaceae bacterium]MDW8249421.1 TlpA disulfide reductase family protein [Myxococcales bacterium]